MIIRTTQQHTHEIIHETHYSKEDKALFGFWAYLMSDCLVFACLFAVYAVLHKGTFGGPTSQELFNMPFVLVETIILLTSSFTYGLASLHAHHTSHVRKVLAWLVVTFLLGCAFVGMEVYEFVTLINEGYGPDRSAFLSAFFVLLGTHGVHVVVGLVWMVVLFIQVYRKGLSVTNVGKLSLLGIFWHFLDIIWIFIFTIVYVLGSMNI